LLSFSFETKLSIEKIKEKIYDTDIKEDMFLVIENEIIVFLQEKFIDFISQFV